jgi:excisionase family DNA binding protein
MEKLLTVGELAECLGISIGTAYHWLSQGRLPCVRFSARCVRFRESDLTKLIEDLARGVDCKSTPDGNQPERASKRASPAKSRVR